MTGEEKTMLTLLILFIVHLIKYLHIPILQVCKAVLNHSKGVGGKR